MTDAGTVTEEWFREYKIKSYGNKVEFYEGIGDKERAQTYRDLIHDLRTIPDPVRRFDVARLRNYKEQQEFFESIGNWKEADKMHGLIYDLERKLRT